MRGRKIARILQGYFWVKAEMRFSKLESAANELGNRDRCGEGGWLQQVTAAAMRSLRCKRQECEVMLPD